MPTYETTPPVVISVLRAGWTPSEFLPGFETLQEVASQATRELNPNFSKGSPDCTSLLGHAVNAVSLNSSGLAAVEQDFSDALRKEDRTARRPLHLRPVSRGIIAQDVKRMRAAEAFLQSEYREAKRQICIKDHFLAALAHELRTPLQAIVVWSEILASGPLDADELAQGINVIRANAVSQSRIIEDLLDMSRIVSGSVRLEMQSVDLAAVIQVAVDSLKPQADLKYIQVHTSFANCPAMSGGDPVRLHQILGNLLTNAIKFTPVAGTVHVELTSTTSHLNIKIADNGKGIAPAFLPLVFDRFLREDATTTRRQDGLGLGLAIVKHLVELHGGSIQVASAGLSLGATFTVTLPIVSPAAILPAAPTLLHAVLADPPVLDARYLQITDTRLRFSPTGHAIIAETQADPITLSLLSRDAQTSFSRPEHPGSGLRALISRRNFHLVSKE